jgi:hypothetical protein
MGLGIRGRRCAEAARDDAGGLLHIGPELALDGIELVDGPRLVAQRYGLFVRVQSERAADVFLALDRRERLLAAGHRIVVHPPARLIAAHRPLRRRTEEAVRRHPGLIVALGEIGLGDGQRAAPLARREIERLGRPMLGGDVGDPALGERGSETIEVARVTS